MQQLALFDRPRSGDGQAGDAMADADSARLLEVFQTARLAEGAHPRSVKREVSQLRALNREAGRAVQPSDLRTLFADSELLARLLREPAAAITRATGRARLLA